MNTSASARMTVYGTMTVMMTAANERKEKQKAGNHKGREEKKHMNANRNKKGRLLKKTVMAAVAAGTLATSVAYPGLLGQPRAQAAGIVSVEGTSELEWPAYPEYNEEAVKSDGVYDYIIDKTENVIILGCTQTSGDYKDKEIKIPEKIDDKPVTRVYWGSKKVACVDISEAKELELWSSVLYH